MKRYVTFKITWKMPDTDRIITDSYALNVPKGIPKPLYQWVGGKRIISYKSFCFLRRLQNI